MNVEFINDAYTNDGLRLPMIHFEDCILDIDLAIEKSKELGYKRFILMGHIYGCNKLIYYYYKKHPNILGLVLASAPDMVGLQLLRQSDYEKLINEAKNNIEKGNATKLLSNLVEDYMYMSSQTYYNWFKKDSNLDNYVHVAGFPGATSTDILTKIDSILKSFKHEEFTNTVILSIGVNDTQEFNGSQRNSIEQYKTNIEKIAKCVIDNGCNMIILDLTRIESDEKFLWKPNKYYDNEIITEYDRDLELILSYDAELEK